MGELFAMVSGKGGTGKTTTCAGLSLALADAGYKVLSIDCDVGLRNLDISLAMTDNGNLSFQDVSEFGYRLSNAPRHSLYPNLAFLTAPMNCHPEDILREPFLKLLDQAREEFDYIFLDSAAGVDAGFRLVTEMADRILVVTGAGPSAIRDAARVAELLDLAGKKDIRLIVNRVDRKMLYNVRMTIDDVMDTAGLPLTGIVPEDTNVALAAAFGIPLLQYAPRGEATKAFRRISERLQGRYCPIIRR